MVPHWRPDCNKPGQMSPTVACLAIGIYNPTQWESVHIFERICDFIWAGALAR